MEHKCQLKTKNLARKPDWLSRGVIVVLLVMMILLLLLYDCDLKLLLVECAVYTHCLLVSHLLYVYVHKRCLDSKELSLAYITSLATVFYHPMCGLDEFPLQMFILTFLSYSLMRYLKMMRSNYKDELQLKNTKYHLGPGLAQAYYRFVENVIKGKKTSPPHVQIMKEVITREQLCLNDNDWFCPKVLILFPEWKKQNRESIWGSVRDITKKEKENGSKHRLFVEPIYHKFMASGGNIRTCKLQVLKNWDETGNWYAMFAENRPLNTLYKMVGEAVIPFSEEDFNRQFQSYMMELRKLLDADEGCRGKYEIFHYKDSGKLNFSKEIIKQMKEIRNEPDESKIQMSDIKFQTNIYQQRN